MAGGNARISILDILSSDLASPILAVRVKELDTNEDGAPSVSELLHALRVEQDLVLQKRLLVRTVGALSVGLLLTIAAVVGLTYAIVDLSKETTVNKNNGLQGKSSKQLVGTANLVDTPPISMWLDTNMTMAEFLGLEVVGFPNEDGLVQFHRLSSVEYFTGAKVVFHTPTQGLSLTLTRQGLQLNDARDEAIRRMLQEKSRAIHLLPHPWYLGGMKTLGSPGNESKWMGTRSRHRHHGRWWWLLLTWWGLGYGKEEKTPRDWDRYLQVGIVYQRPVDMKQFVKSWKDLVKHTMVWDPKVYATYKLWEAPDIEQKLRNVLRSLLLDVRRSFLQADVGLGNEGFAMQALLRRAMEDKCDVVVLLEPTVSLTPRWLNPLVAALASDTAIAAVAPINNQLGFREYPKMTTVLNEPDVRDKEGNALESAPLDEMARLAFLLSNNSVISVTELEGFVTAFPFDMLQREFFMMQIEKVLWRAVAQGLQTFLERLLEVSYQILLVPKSYVHVDNIQPPALQPEVEIAIDMNAGGAITLVRPTKMVRPNYTWHCRPLVMAKRSFTTHLATSLSTDKKFRVLFVLNKMSQKPDFVMRGGWISIVQECLGLALHNVHVRMAIPSWTMAYFEEAFPEAAERKIFLPFAGTSNNKIAMELIQRKEAFDFLVATLFTTVSTVEKLHAVYPNSIKSYYVQDIENHFDQGLTAMAESTYRRMVDGFVFVKTKYLENELRKTYGVKAQVIPPTVDTDRFNPNHRISSPADTLTACGMVRTSTPRRNPFGTYKVLASALARHGPDKLKVIVFGSTLEELQRMLELHGEDTTFPAGLEFLGNLNRAEVASILHKCDLFLDFSEWQAFGRSGLECMAAGCIPILPLTGGSSEYAVHGRNAFLLNSSDVEAGVKLIDQVLYNTYDIGRMREAAVTRAARFSIPRSGKITSDLFGTVLAKKRRLNSFLKPSNVIPC